MLSNEEKQEKINDYNFVISNTAKREIYPKVQQSMLSNLLLLNKSMTFWHMYEIIPEKGSFVTRSNHH